MLLLSIIPFYCFKKLKRDSSNDFTGAVSALARNDKTRRAITGEAARVVTTDSALTVIQLTLIHILASTARLPYETRIAFAFVAFLGIDAFSIAADVRS